MNVVMLGHSGAGKTTYMALMYDAMTAGIEGFTVHAASEQVHRSLVTSAKKIRTGKYPPLSSHRHVYDLTLQHGGSSVLKFTWKDYRGGALSERTNSDQTAELLEDLRATDGIVVFVDATELIADMRAPRKVRRLSVLVHRAMEERDRTVALVLALTKCDLLAEDTDQDLLLRHFHELIRAVSQTRHIFGTIIPLACGPQPVNVVFPVLFCVHFGLRASAEYLNSLMNVHLSVARAAGLRDTRWDRIRSWATGAPSSGQMSAYHYLEAYRAREELAPLLAPGEQLGDLLNREQLFVF